MASVYRRLHGIFSKSVTLTQNAQNGIIKTSPPSKPPTQKTTTTTAASSAAALNPSSKKMRRLEKLVEQCKQFSNSSRYRTRYLNYEALVLRLASSNQLSLIEDVVEHLKTYKDVATERYTIRLIGLYGKAGMFDHARKVFDEMPQLNCQRTVSSMNALLAACINSKNFDKFDELLKELPVKLSIDPDVVTYNTVIKALCEKGSLDIALLVPGKMEEKGVEPDLISFNTLLDYCYVNDRFSDGEKIWAMIEDKNLGHTIRSYNSKLRGLVFEGKVLEAVELFDELKSKGLKPDVFSYNAMIKGFCNDGNLEEVKSWYKNLLKGKCVPDKFTFSMLIPFLCENGDFDMAFEFCKEILKRRCLVNVALMQLVVDGLAKESKMEEAMELVKLGRSNDHHCYNLELSLDK